MFAVTVQKIISWTRDPVQSTVKDEMITLVTIPVMTMGIRHVYQESTFFFFFYYIEQITSGFPWSLSDNM